MGKGLENGEHHIIRRGRMRTRPQIRFQAGLLGRGAQISQLFQKADIRGR